MANEISTANTHLYSGVDKASVAELVPIVDFPDLFGAPDSIEVTNLSDTHNKRYIAGLVDSGTLEFTVNYIASEYVSILAKETTDKYFEIRFSDNSGFYFTGALKVEGVAGAGVGDALTYKIALLPDSKISHSADLTAE